MLDRRALQHGPTTGGPKTLLLVNAPESMVTDFFVRELGRVGFAVFAARDFRQAWAICEELHFDVALVLENFEWQRGAAPWRNRDAITVLDCLRLHQIPSVLKTSDNLAGQDDASPVVCFIGEPLRLDEVLEALNGVISGTHEMSQPEEAAAD